MSSTLMFPKAQRSPDWAGIEKYFSELHDHESIDRSPDLTGVTGTSDCIPANAREWKNFIDVYENCVKWLDGSMADPSIPDADLGDKKMDILFLGHGYKRSPMEAYGDLLDFIIIKLLNKYSCNLRLCMLVKWIWDGDLSGEGLRVMPRCLSNYPDSFFCTRNKLKSLFGGPKWVGGSMDCSNNEITTLADAPEFVGGTVVCWENKLPANIPDSFDGKDLDRYRHMKANGVMEFATFKANNER